MKSKFDFYDIVLVSSHKEYLSEINDTEGVIKGMSQNEETGAWGYAVSMYSDEGFVWDIMEPDLVATGKKANPKDFETGESIRVRVDPETGEGTIIDDEDK